MNSPLLLGHRGARASQQVPENTNASFALCLEHGCDGFEFDLRCSADGQAVVCHDAVSRGLEVAKTTVKDLGLPTLEGVLEQFSGRAFLDIELKVAGLARQTARALQLFPPQKGYVVSSFLPEILNEIHALDNAIPLGLLCETDVRLSEMLTSLLEWVILRVDLVERSLAETLQSAGKKVMVWNVSHADEMRRLADWGVEAIITDETDTAVRVLRV
jgi:glycerophosphoryl diester phosphodiesterase